MLSAISRFCKSNPGLVCTVGGTRALPRRAMLGSTEAPVALERPGQGAHCQGQFLLCPSLETAD